MPPDFVRELERLRRKNHALKCEIRYAMQALDYAWKMVSAIREGVTEESDFALRRNARLDELNEGA